jgi:tetratricopeptide (TPR) repeat protein
VVSDGKQFRAPLPVLTAALLLLAPPISSAAPGFIASSHVRDGNLYEEITVRFRCGIQYLGHDPSARGDMIRIRLETTSVCTGAAPTAANVKEQYRPVGADVARLESIEYDGEIPGGRSLRLNFTETVRFDVDADNDTIRVRVFPIGAAEAADTRQSQEQASRQVPQPSGPQPRYVINLQSEQRPFATADMPQLDLAGTEVFVTEATIEGARWYRLRVGYFGSAEEASQALASVRSQYPGAWIDRAVDKQNRAAAAPAIPAPVAAAPQPATQASAASQQATSRAAALPDDRVAKLMDDAHHAMTAGEISRAVQIYTKVLQLPPNDYQPDAQEYLALARERNGQIAHAKAEYKRYLDVYPDGPGAERVQQRLAALVATARRDTPNPQTAAAQSRRARPVSSPWSVRTFLSQYYRRDVNQVNDLEEIVSQSSIYSDVSLDARRRGDRFDFSARVTAGYRNNLMDETVTQTTNDLRLSYAYADLADARTGLRGRIGRQTRNTGGVLGRFDGVNLTYAINDRLRFEAVGGRPVYSTARDVDDSRRFEGLSTTFAPFAEDLELGVFYLQQDIEGLTDRQAVGAEVRYFGDNQTFWSIVDYDIEFDELGSVFLQGSWRLPANFTITGLVDRRQSPFLSLGNAMIGQQVEDFAQLLVFYTEDEIRQFALDRSATTTTYSVGMSRPFSPKLSLNLNASTSSVEGTPDSGGVSATPDSEYSYYSADFVASCVFTQGDVGIMGFRYAVTETTDVYSTMLDTRFPIGRKWRISPRVRVDYREIKTDGSVQWIYTPALRIQFRPGRRVRLEFQGGMQFSTREMATTDQERESWFVNVGYQYFY